MTLDTGIEWPVRLELSDSNACGPQMRFLQIRIKNISNVNSPLVCYKSWCERLILIQTAEQRINRVPGSALVVHQALRAPNHNPHKVDFLWSG